MAQETITAQDILQKSVDRNRYFRGKLLSVRDLTQEQDYFNSKRWLLNRLLFGAGVICGLQVEESGTEPPVLIRAGLALDPLGREVTVIEDSKFDLKRIIKLTDPLFTGPKTGYVCLAQRDCPKEPAPSISASPCDTACESSRWHETFDVSWDEDVDPPPAQTLCASWLNRTTVQEEDPTNVKVERTTPVWVRPNQVFEVVVRVSAFQDSGTIRLAEAVTNGTVIEPSPALGGTGQFPAPPVKLKAGEFFVYMYQVKAPGSVGSITVSTSTPGVPSPISTIQVVSLEDAAKNEHQFDLQRICSNPRSTCVRIAKLRVNFTNGNPTGFSILPFTPPRFRYSLERVTEMLDCVRASLTAEAGSARPGHAFVTFNDFDTDPPTPIGPTASPGTGFTFAGGDHAHELRRATDSGLEWSGESGNELRINGPVGGDAIKFLNTVKGQRPVESEDLVTKDYVDAVVAGLDWQESVLDKDLTAPPEGPKEGARFLLFNEPATPFKASKGSGKKNDIVTFNGKVWEIATPDEGTAAFVEDENIAYMFVDGAWIPFLAAPEVTAGDGLVAKGAVLSVGKGKGIVVNPNDVAVAIEKNEPLPIGAVGSAGNAETLSASDHVHALALLKDGGLVFDGKELRIDGPASGEKISFLNPVEGAEPKTANHLATKQYVDDHASTVSAGDGLVQKESTLHVGAGAGIKVNPDDVSVAFESGLPRPIGPVGSAGTARTASAGDHVHAFPLTDRGGLVFDGKAYAIDGIIVGETISFANPVSGATPRLNEHLATKAYVDGKTIPQGLTSVGGDGLIQQDNTLSVGPGDGILVGKDSVAVRFSEEIPQPDAEKGAPGKESAAARSDHIHPLTPFTTGAASGLITFRFPDKPFVAQAEVNPELGPGHLSVQLAMLLGTGSYLFLGNADSPFDLTAEVRTGSPGKPSTFIVRVDSTQFEQPLPQGLQIRWFAYTPGIEREPVEGTPIG